MFIKQEWGGGGGVREGIEATQWLEQEENGKPKIIDFLNSNTKCCLKVAHKSL